MNTRQKKTLYESIMKNVVKSLKTQLDESDIITDENGVKILNTKNNIKRDLMYNYDNTESWEADDEYMPYIDYLDIAKVLSNLVDTPLPISLNICDYSITDERINSKVNEIISNCAKNMVEFLIIKSLITHTSENNDSSLQHISNIMFNKNSKTVDLIVTLDYPDEELSSNFRSDNPFGYNYTELRRNFEVKSFSNGNFNNITLTEPQIEILQNNIISLNFILIDYSISENNVIINDIYIVTPKIAQESLTPGITARGKHLSNNIVKIANDINDARVISVKQYKNNMSNYLKLVRNYNNQFKKHKVNFTRGHNNRREFK